MTFDGIVEIIAYVFILAGSLFYVIGGIGLVRMPEIFTRMHAVSLADTVGAGLLLAGLVLLSGFTLVSAKLIIIAVAIFFTLPVATHALAQAALAAHVKPALDGDGSPDGDRSKSSG